MNEKPYTSPQPTEDAAVLEDSGCSLVLFNADVPGRCTVRHGSYTDLLPMHTALLDKQLTSEIQ